METLHTRAAALALAVTTLLAGCTVGPNYDRPPVTAPDTFRGDTSTTTSASIGEEPWAAVFPDATLQQLITEALSGNISARIAAARVLQAAAQLGITRADQLPTVTGQANGSGQRGTIFAGQSVPTIGIVQASVGLNWEIDFWGRFRRATEAARAELAATEWGQRAIVTSLVSEVAAQYFLLRALDLQRAEPVARPRARPDRARTAADRSATSP
jgi:multidrug efflux system outer membrane protein